MTESVAVALRDEILSGRLTPGSRLQQTAVAERFNVSITPVREAFSLLVRWGLVTNEAHRGCSVFKPEPEDLRRNYEIRIALEELATLKGVPHLTDADIEKMEAVLELARTVDDQDPERHIQLNEEFHSTIYKAADNPKLEEIIEELRLKTVVYLRIFNTKGLAREKGARQHQEILEACRRRAPKEAAKCLRRHLEHTFDVVMETLGPTPDSSREPDSTLSTAI